MKTTELNPFEETIKNQLEIIASNDPLFAKSLKKENKNIKECVNYIYDTVRKSGRIGFNDDEIFNMAIHYYDEDDITDIKSTNCKVVVNHASDVKITDYNGRKVPVSHKEKPKKEVKQKTQQKPIKQLAMF